MIIRPDPAQEYFFAEGCDILELQNHADDEALSIARATVAPGVTTRWHSLEAIVERYLVLAGNGFVEIGDQPGEIISEGELAVIPAGVRQRITNRGETPLVFLAICTPRFKESSYTDLEA